MTRVKSLSVSALVLIFAIGGLYYNNVHRDSRGWRVFESRGGFRLFLSPYYGLSCLEIGADQHWALLGDPPYYSISSDGHWHAFVTKDFGRLGKKDDITWLHLISDQGRVISKPIIYVLGPRSKTDVSDFRFLISTNGLAQIEDEDKLWKIVIKVDLNSGTVISIEKDPSKGIQIKH